MESHSLRHRARSSPCAGSWEGKGAPSAKHRVRSSNKTKDCTSTKIGPTSGIIASCMSQQWCPSPSICLQEMMQDNEKKGPHGVQDMLSDACVHASLHHLVLNERDHQRDFQVHLDVLVDHFCVVAFTVLELDVRKMRRVQHGDRTRVLHLTRFNHLASKYKSENKNLCGDVHDRKENQAHRGLQVLVRLKTRGSDSKKPQIKGAHVKHCLVQVEVGVRLLVGEASMKQRRKRKRWRAAAQELVTVRVPKTVHSCSKDGVFFEADLFASVSQFSPSVNTQALNS